MRLRSLDVFRGIAIACMILVNNPGSWASVYPPLLHAEWNGCTPTDLIFPSFLFIVGVAMAFSLQRYIGDNQPNLKTYKRIIKRCLILFGLGLLLNGFPTYSLDTIRIMGVLQRIGLAYLLSALCILKFKRYLGLIIILILLGYWGAMIWIPVPGYGAGILTPEGNLGAYLDRMILGTAHLYQQGLFDPEGLFSSLVATVTVLIGYLTGECLRTQKSQSRTSMGLVLFGIGCIGLGAIWGLFFPINKSLWTSSYCVFTAGWSLLLLALCYELIEVRRFYRLGWVFEVMGLNAIFLFVGSGFLTRILSRIKIEGNRSLYSWIYVTFFKSWLGGMNGSLGFALTMLIFWWLGLYFMYRRKWFIKV